MENTHIQWTDRTDNPIVKVDGGFYCFKVSPGCTNCYAERDNNRFNHETHQAYKNMKTYPHLKLRHDILEKWAKMKRRRRIFVSSMTDVFGEFVPAMFVFEILDAMIAAPQHIFQVLTKRSARMKKLVKEYCQATGIPSLPLHIYLIVSVERQKEANERIYDLCTTMCGSRGLSMEPLLGRVELTGLEQDGVVWNCLNGIFNNRPPLTGGVLGTIDWVIVGGESGHKARPMNPDWVSGLHTECMRYSVPFFFKQWGEYSEYEVVDPTMDIVEDGRGGKGYKHLCMNDAGETSDDARTLIGQQVVLYRFGRSLTGRKLKDVEYNEMPGDMQALVDENAKKYRLES